MLLACFELSPLLFMRYNPSTTPPSICAAFRSVASTAIASSDQRIEYIIFPTYCGFVSAIWLVALSAYYGLSNYLTALKDVLIGLYQKQLNRLIVGKDLGL
ncbi:hypothetical protein GOP47_0010973 [Adiantum capillus-veneris]|uniref:Uncharacterized protein n=1 Tax=Adiantum capillus-veneris TaxID=13818 RepID=A0A9D4UX52_ADICA|nr:hypothetical protein GOP47_0010973 [Adiantum capillus-veneris]